MIKKLFSRMDPTVRTFTTRLLPALIVMLMGIGLWAASNLQTWQTQSGARVSAADSNGSFNCNNAISVSTSANTPAISSSGSITFAVPSDGAYYKQVIIAVNSLTTTGAVTFAYPIPFTQQPYVNGLASTSTTLSMTTGTAGTFTNGLSGGTLATSGVAAATTGLIIVEGQ